MLFPSLIYYNEGNNTCRPCGWISHYEIAHGSFERLSGPKRELIMIPQSELCPNFYALLHHPPGEYRWQCRTSKAHQIVGSLLHTANRLSNQKFLGGSSDDLIRTDYWAKEDFFDAVNKLHKKLHFLGYDDDDIIRETVSKEDQKLAVKALIRGIAKERGCEQIYHDLIVDIR